MNINYHYFAVKTLGSLAGLKEEVAQKIAYCSQMVDDFSCKRPTIFLSEKPDEFFLDNRIAAEWGNYYSFSPIRTAISFTRCLEPIHCKKTVVPFHFMPESEIDHVENALEKYNGSYICKKAMKENAADEKTLIWQEVDETVDCIKKAAPEKNCDYEIIKLGMLFHVFADTFAHYGFSGVHGKENWAEIEEIYLNDENINLDSFKDKLMRYSNLSPEVGHACLLHLPDAAGYKVKVKRCTNEEANRWIVAVRDNRETFMYCSEILYKWLSELSNTSLGEKSPIPWEDVSDKFLMTLCKASRDYTETDDFGELKKKWEASYGDLKYSYEKNIYNLSSSMKQISDPYDKLTEEELAILETGSFEDIEALGLLEKLVIAPSNDFFYYNKAAYEHRNKVIGYYKI